MSRRRENGEIDPCIDIVIGNNHKKDLVRILREYEENREKDRADGTAGRGVRHAYSR